MNEATLDAFQEFIVTANEASYEEISNLTPESIAPINECARENSYLSRKKSPMLMPCICCLR